ncbi:AAA family ATPase [Archangium sp.]|uniref:AAA family ATPase n=1 Tax=Archangium sp. TaxID=1872627 RepID=UPI00286C0D67|nr:AAA family ATPase [Archangium sp.]
MVKLRWLQVNKFRSVKPGTLLTFNDGHNVLLGQNGTGKTTLLNLVAATIKSNFADFKNEVFDVSYALDSEMAMATVSVRNEHQALPLPTALESLSPGVLGYGALPSEGGLRSPVLSVTASVSNKQTGLRLEIEINGERGTIRRTDGTTPGPSFGLSRTTAKNLPPWMLLLSGLGEWGNKNPPLLENATALFDLFLEVTTARFDESLEYFNNLGELQLRVTRHPNEDITLFGSLDPRGTTYEQLGSLGHKTWGADRYVLSATDLPFLKQTIQLLDFESAEAIIELKESGQEDGADFMQLGNLRFYFSHRGGWKISEKALSYGQKRMLAFMYYLTTVKSTIIADELVNGLHHRWIRACFETLGQRQVFLTSQNPLLLDYLNFQSPEDVRSTFVLCTWEKSPEQMVWENMTQEAAEDFFASYKVGFQQVGELLQSKGLW